MERKETNKSKINNPLFIVVVDIHAAQYLTEDNEQLDLLVNKNLPSQPLNLQLLVLTLIPTVTQQIPTPAQIDLTFHRIMFQISDKGKYCLK